MQRDMHYYSIFYLALAAGLSVEDAYIIAYSSQFTDDSLEYRPFRLADKNDNSGVFDPICTQHTSINSFTEEISDKVFFPFHFVPSFIENGLPDETAITVPYTKNKQFEKMVDEIFKKGNLYRIGIMLHAMADSFAHQRFSGEWSVVNEIHRLRYIVRIRMMSSKLLIAISKIFMAYLKRFFQWLLSLLAPEIGHARAYHIPDYPYALWRYRNFEKVHIARSNPDIFFNCGTGIFERFKRMAKANSRRQTDHEVCTLLKTAVYRCGTMKRRERFWKKQIRNLSESGKFPDIPEQLLKYSPTYWKELEFKENRSKIKELKPRKRPYRLKNTLNEFKKSHYYQFQKEAREQRIEILKMLQHSLPRVESSLQDTNNKQLLRY